jgi:hypothetical protein
MIERIGLRLTGNLSRRFGSTGEFKLVMQMICFVLSEADVIQ